METGPGQFGKWLVMAGILLSIAGAVLMLLGKLGIFRLPGDFQFGGKGWKVYIPLTSCIIISIVLTVIFWVMSRLNK